MPYLSRRNREAGNRRNCWGLLSPLLSADRRRLMSVLVEVGRFRNFRGEIKINTPRNHQLEGDDIVKAGEI